jgi:polyisoprenoid-binding protein YceI
MFPSKELCAIKQTEMAKFKIQTSSSTVNWTGKKVLGLHTGNISIADGFVDIVDGTIEGGEIQIDMASIVITDIENRQTRDEFLAHLMNDDFFSVDRFKTARLTVTGSSKLENKKLEVDGYLTIKDITHPVSFIATVEIFTDFLHSLGEIVIDRTLYNIRYGSGKFVDNLGDKLIHDDFVLQFKLVGQL